MAFIWVFMVRLGDRMYAGNHLVRITPYKRLQDLLLPFGKSVRPVIRMSAVNSSLRRADGAGRARLSVAAKTDRADGGFRERSRARCPIPPNGRAHPDC